MIWRNTLAKMAAENLNIFRVTIPRHRIPTETGCIVVTEQEELFSTRYRAESWAATFTHTSPVIDEEPANLYFHSEYLE